MIPESPLFPAYQEALKLDAAATEFNRRAYEAFDVLSAEGRSESYAEIDFVDATDIQACLSNSSLPEGQLIARAFERVDEERPVQVELRPAHESFEHGGRTVESRFGLVSGGLARHHTVFRLVAMTEDATQVPDARGYYVARSNTGTITFFKVEADIPTTEQFSASRFAGATATSRAAKYPTQLEEAASGGRPYQMFKINALDAPERIAMLDEMEKAATVLPQVRRR